MTISDVITRVRSRFHRFLSDCLADQARKGHRREYMRRYMSDVYRKDRRSRSITLTDAEDRRIVKAAQKSGRKPATFIREAVFAYMDKRYLVPVNQETALHAVAYQLGALGNNLNQIARRVHTERKASSEDVKAARTILERAESLITSFVTSPPEYSPTNPPSPSSNGDQKHEP